MRSNSSNTLEKHKVSINDQISICIACTDDSILDEVNTLMKDTGIISISNTTGGVQFIVDARYSKTEALVRLHNFLIDCGREKNVNKYEVSRNMPYIEAVLNAYNMNHKYIGTKLVGDIIDMILQGEITNRMTLKHVYIVLASYTGQSYYQVERDIRYALERSDCPRTKYTKMQLFVKMAREARRYKEKALSVLK